VKTTLGAVVLLVASSAACAQSSVTNTADHYWLGATCQATPKWAVTAAGFYIHVGEGGGDVSHDPASHAMLYALGTTRNLSARTFLYGTVAYVNNSKSGTFSVFATPRDSSTPTSPMAGHRRPGPTWA